MGEFEEGQVMKHETKEVLVIIRNLVDVLLGWAKFSSFAIVLMAPLLHGRPMILVGVAGAFMATYFVFCWGEGRG